MSYAGSPLPVSAPDSEDSYEVLPGLYRTAVAAARDAARRNRQSFETWLTRAIMDALQREATAPEPLQFSPAAPAVDVADLLRRLDQLAAEVAELRQRLGSLEAPSLSLLRNRQPRADRAQAVPGRRPLSEVLYGSE
jgi:hypothetical protein